MSGAELLRKRMTAALKAGRVRRYLSLRRRWLKAGALSLAGGAALGAVFTFAVWNLP